MERQNLTRSFPDLVGAEVAKHKWLAGEYAKVRRVLKGYAASRELSLSNLTLLLVCDDRDSGEICQPLSAFIDGLPQPVRYKHEVRSRLRRILRALSSHASREPAVPVCLAAYDCFPEFIRPILPHLPRQGNPGVTPERRMELPLTEQGQLLLTVLLLVAERNCCANLEALLVGSRHLIYRAIKQEVPPRKWSSVRVSMRTMLRRLGYRTSNSQIIARSIPNASWPLTLREEFSRLVELAPLGIDHDLVLAECAAKNHIKVVPLMPSTLNRYEKAIAAGLFIILPAATGEPTDIGVMDLLRLEPVVLDDALGKSTRLVNPLVEKLREDRSRRTTKSKRVGYDDVLFKHFLSAIKTLAAYNGYFAPLVQFKKAYKSNPDTRKIHERKRIIRETFDLQWIDSEIGRMLPEFRRIIRHRSYVMHRTFPFQRGQKNMRFCLFFVLLVMLRYMGHRQQQIRRCEIGRNVVFSGDGSIHFNWKAKEIKNKNELDQFLDRDNHLTHRFLIDVLRAYYFKMYRPYISKNPAITPDGRDLMENQLFVYVTAEGSFRRFDPDDNRRLSRRFSSWSCEFMDFNGRANTLEKGLNTHYFRGIAADWMVDDLGVTIAKVAAFIGDTEQTLKRHYLREDPKMIAAPALEEANNNLKSKERKHSMALIENKKISELKEELGQRDQLLFQASQRIEELQSEIISLLKK